ncbi:heavy metal-binding domain-containing protein [Shewanella baltica]|uniref:heavy metal-binding domain-containing protein n=1 Tax=Shewanella baltica TaxID=62322 RepID=UPI00321896D1
MKTLTNLALIAFLLTSTSVFATARPHEHQHDNANPQQQAQTYVCPMHPEVTGTKGDSCPKCGMDLEPKATEAKTAEGAMHNAHEHH